MSLLTKIPQYKCFRQFNRPRLLPLNYTISLTYRCNSRCKTCNIWFKKTDELTIEEYKKIFTSMGTSPYWITISGGEPFLRKDIVEIIQCLYKTCRPKIINIPTNGILTEIIVDKVKNILTLCPGTKLVINVSLDEIGEKHDEIRNIKDNFAKTIKTFNNLKKINHPNLTVGIHTVVSKFNFKRLPEIASELISLNPDSYITEIAEKRVELDTINSDITPSLEEYTTAIDELVNILKTYPASGLGKITRAFRFNYYNMVKKVLKEKRQIIPCYAGFSSCHIAPNGDVWMCCIKADPIGNLRQANYDFREIWFSEKAKEERKKIKNGSCFCPLANASYTNMLFNIKTLVKIALTFF
ncbi:MAG: radical SAM protein [bacterium]|nr:radical SAM protein [bacterium]